MRRILYISTARTALTPVELREILRISRRNNSAAGITGLLVSGGRRFLQAIEGPDEAVGETFARISGDPRHHALVKLHDGSIEARAFGEWAMGFEAGGASRDNQSLQEQVASIVEPLADATLRAYFGGFAQRHGTD